MEQTCIFTVTAGRSGTAYLAKLLQLLPDTRCFHEPEPQYQQVMRDLQKNTAAAGAFLDRCKIPVIQTSPARYYIETTHYVCKGFIEAFVERGIIPTLILLKRNPRAIAASWFCIGRDFHAKPGLTYQNVLHPEDRRPLFLRLREWKDLNNYQLSYWYALECNYRMLHYAGYIAEHGGTSIDISLERLLTHQDLPALINGLGYAPDQELMSRLARSGQPVVNSGTRFASYEARKTLLHTFDLQGMEQQVHERLMPGFSPYIAL